jgi:hypothetical protein
MRATWNLRPGTARLTVVLLVACLTVALLAAGAQARPTQLGRVSNVGVSCEMVPAWDEGT